MRSWYEHWNNHCRYDNQRFISCLTDAKYIVENDDGVKSALETVCVHRAPSGDPADNIITCRFIGGKDEFNYREEEIHKRIVAWK